jgi:hypothetical protein
VKYQAPASGIVTLFVEPRETKRIHARYSRTSNISVFSYLNRTQPFLFIRLARTQIGIDEPLDRLSAANFEDPI